jgi:hypothetical protein
MATDRVIVVSDEHILHHRNAGVAPISALPTLTREITMSRLRFVAASIAPILLLSCSNVGTADEAAYAALQRYYLEVAQQKYEPLFAQKFAAPQREYVLPKTYVTPQKSYVQKSAVPQKYVVPQKSYAVPIKAVHRKPEIIFPAACNRSTISRETWPELTLSRSTGRSATSPTAWNTMKPTFILSLVCFATRRPS